MHELMREMDERERERLYCFVVSPPLSNSILPPSVTHILCLALLTSPIQALRLNNNKDQSRRKTKTAEKGLSKW